MSNTSPASGFWNYVAECVRLLYWIYFKPFTFERWLRDIHPELKPTDDPFAKRTEFRTNPRLRRYAGQVWWLTAVVPMFAVFLVAPVYTLISGESFNWFKSCIFLVGWFIGRVVNRGGNKNRLVILLVAVLSMFLTYQFLSSVEFDVAFGMAFGGAVGLVIGLAGGVAVGLGGVLAGGLPGGMVFGVAVGVVFGVTVSVVFSVAVGVAVGVVLSVVLGVGFGVAVGVAVGVAFGVGFGVVWILGVLRVYFWLPELLWILTLFLLSSNGKRVNCLRYLPPRFDELIILPLPFMDVMIVEAYRKDPIAARETINYLITSTNQQKVAAQAISGIAVDIVNRCQRLSDIVEIANQLAWIPSPSPKELGTVLPQFLEISQNVRASEEATSHYRKYELLNIPINALRQLGQSLALTKDARVAVSFGNTAQSWLTILETAQRTLEEQAQQSKEIRQVYIAGNSLDPKTAKNRFKGRIDIFREIESLALSEQPPVLLLYGGRRTGKTSALKYLPYRIQANIVPLLIDLQGAASATTLKGLAENLAQQIIEAARRLPRKVFLPNPDANKLAEDPFPALQTWLAEIERNNSGKQFLLCLDEYERLGEVVKATSSRAPLNFIRNLLQHQRKWILLFSGSQELSELDDYWSDYLINTRALRMTYLHELEARDLIQQPVENFRNIYEPTAVDEIIQLTRCQPYLVQLVCYEVVELLNRDIRRNRREADTAIATAQDVQEVIPVVLERGDQYFRELWRSLADSDRSLLRRIIYGETPTQQDKGVVRKLTRKEILTPEGNAFQVPLVQKYIEQLLEEE
ncbi:AAA family ATPase [Nostoc sp. UCD121]|uniref:ATP-binding protein n=1 Tax=unclassified Nostoc TaxID=2593658 RepID=UPI0016246118|nr:MULTISPECIES: ATP-binding protein [unclassified Nostoc]MBC1220930.1 AAA family ATPase [Nostoc sp. UCD120]MBC1279703.1 AAA family ATPase [Nostoc sp. UCD121]MBC1296313.1 AAA family ATPase [Nostoc sp. UCD122]